MTPGGAKEMKKLQGIQLTSAATFILEGFAIAENEQVSGDCNFVLAKNYWQWAEGFGWELGFKYAGHVPIWVFTRKKPNI